RFGAISRRARRWAGGRRHRMRDRPPRRCEELERQRGLTEERHVQIISLERSLPVNAVGSASPISRAEVWRGLVLKADNALPFVPQMTYCKVLERESASRFIREVELRGDRMRERVT